MDNFVQEGETRCKQCYTLKSIAKNSTMRITTTLCVLAVLGLSACQKSEQVTPLGDLDTRTLHLPESVPANPLEAPASRATIDAEALELLQRDGHTLSGRLEWTAGLAFFT